MKYDFYIVSSQTNNGYFSLWSWTYLMLGLTGTFLQNWNPLALYLIFTSPKTKIHVLQMIWNYWLNLGYFSLVWGGVWLGDYCIDYHLLFQEAGHLCLDKCLPETALHLKSQSSRPIQNCKSNASTPLPPISLSVLTIDKTLL